MIFGSRAGRWPLLMCVLLLGACAKPDEAEILARANAQLKDGKFSEAIINARNLLQANAQSAPARLLLGRALLSQGDPVSAAVELARARELKAPAAQVEPLLARAWLTQGLAKKVIGEFSTIQLDDRGAQADLLGTVAAAHLALGQLDAAEKVLQAALSQSPPSAEVQLVKARLTAARGDIDGALQQLQSVAQAKPRDALPLSIAGELQYRKGDVDAALVTFRRAVEVDPGMAAAHTGIISILLARKDDTAARKQFDALLAARPNHPDTRYFKAQFAYLAGDLKLAREELSKLHRYDPDNVRVLQLEALVSVRLNELQQAESALNKVLQLQPSQASARRLLALVNQRLGREERSLSLLAPLLDATPPDLEAMSMAANLHLSRGDAASAEALYRRAVSAAPNDPSVRIALALSRLARGDSGAFEALQAVADAEAEPAADLAIVSVRLSRGELDAAQRALTGLRRKMTGSPLPDQLAGRIAVLRGDTAAARQAFAAALKIDPLYFPAVASLVGLDLGDGDLAAGHARMAALAQASPNDLRARLAMIELNARRGATRAETTDALAKAISQLPEEPMLRVQLVEHLLASHDVNAALLAAREAATVLPNDPAVLNVLGRVHLVKGDGQQAVAAYARLAALQPKSPQPSLRLASAYRVLGKPQQAADSLRQAVAAAPGDSVAVREAIEAHLQAREYDAALAAASALQKARPEAAEGLILQGDVEAMRGNWPAALSAYRAAVSKSRPGDKAAAALHRALLRARQPAEAEAFLASHARAHPGDLDFALYRADRQVLRGDLKAAEAAYAQLLDKQPNNIAALNNLAWLLAKRGDAGALRFARRAVALQPENPSLLDTLALALGVDGQHARGIEIAKRAMTMAPEAPALRLTLARLYIQAGDRARAREELTQLARLGERFDGQAAVARLLKSLDA